MPPLKKIADFESPPVVEVVFGVVFEPLPLDTVQMGLMWIAMGPDAFPFVQDMPPIADPIPPDGNNVTFKLSNLPPLRRVWFLSADKSEIIQIQTDRFHLNHRRETLEQNYVDYVDAYPAFAKRYDQFKTALKEIGHEPPTPRRYELTYINLITPDSRVWATLADIGAVLPDVSWRSTDRFLASPSDMKLNFTFPMDDTGGELQVSVHSGTAPAGDEPVVQLRLTAAGPANQRDGGFEAWFEEARSWIVRGFTDLTSARMRSEVWKQRQPGEDDADV